MLFYYNQCAVALNQVSNDISSETHRLRKPISKLPRSEVGHRKESDVGGMSRPAVHGLNAAQRVAQIILVGGCTVHADARGVRRDGHAASVRVSGPWVGRNGIPVAGK